MSEIELKEYLKNQKRVGQREDNSSFEGGLKHMIHVRPKLPKWIHVEDRFGVCHLERRYPNGSTAYRTCEKHHPRNVRPL